MGVLVRILFALLFNHPYDFFTFLVMGRSVADTGSVIDGFFVIHRMGPEIQIVGKIYYQIIAAWLLFLDAIKISNLSYIFDTKPFVDTPSYMTGFMHWAPPVYKLLAIKMIHLVFDFIYLFFLLKIANLLNLKNKNWLVLFWAFNVFTIFSAYGQFQSDLAMTSILLGGVYFALKSIKFNADKPWKREKFIAVILLAVGTLVKLVPALITPVLLILISPSILAFFAYTGTFLLTYVLLGQQWGGDGEMMRHFFLNTPESFAVLQLQYNQAPLIILLLICVYLFVFVYRKDFRNNIHKILYVIALIFSFVYLTEDTTFLFPQFNTWIMPFIALISLIEPLFALFLLAPILGYIKRTFLFNDFFAGSLSVFFGPALNDLYPIETLLKNKFSPQLVNFIMNSLFFLLHGILSILLIGEILTKKWKHQLFDTFSFLKKIDLKIMLKVLVIIYVVFLSFDYIVKSKYVTIKSGSFKNSDTELSLSTKPFVIDIDNPNRKTINAIEIRMSKKEFNSPDYILLKIKDKDTGETLVDQKQLDFFLPEKAEFTPIFLEKGVNRKNMSLELSVQYSRNKIYVYGTEKTKDPDLNNYGLSTLYESPKSDNSVNISYPDKGFQVRIRGQYSWNNVIQNIGHHISERPKIYAVYFSLLLGIGLIPFILKRISKNST